jgi:hypothetical protein
MSDVDYEYKFREIARLQHKEIERLHGELDKLRAENQRLLNWIMGEGPDALLALQKVYSDPKTSVPDVIKSASAALGYERSKPAQVSVVIDFKERVRTARLRQLELDKAEWARQDAEKKLDLAVEPAPTVLGGPPGYEGEADPAA